MLAPIRNNPKVGKAASADVVVDLVLVPERFRIGVSAPACRDGPSPVTSPLAFRARWGSIERERAMRRFIHAGSEWVAATLLSTLWLILSCAPKVEEPPDPYVAGGDLREILERGALRVLVPTLPEDDLQRAGAPDVEDREMVLAFAARLGLGCEFISVDSRSEILERLEGGYGDVVTAQLTVTPERDERLRFTRPTSVVDEWLVG